MKLDVLNTEGGKTGRQVDLPDSVFGAEPNEHAVYLAVKAYLANQRQGTHKAKERNEITGSTRKIKRQKGTGTARAGDIKNPLFRGGGRIFGPRPRNYTQRLNKKVKRLARVSALAGKAADKAIVVLEDFSMDAPQTKKFNTIVDSLNLSGKKTLLVTSDYEKEIYLSSRNLPNVVVMGANDLNTYQIMNANTLVLAEGAVEKIKESLA